MWIAVVPAYNEALSVSTVIKNLSQAKVDLLLLVANGCTDMTCSESLRAAKESNQLLKILHFPKPLGIDVPKAVGAAFALNYNPKGVLFVDGDMGGQLTPVFRDLMEAVEGGLDLALTNCYPTCQPHSELAEQVLEVRKSLNRHLNLYSRLQAATPSHGPHVFRGSLLKKIDLRNLAVPPKALVQAAWHSVNIGIGAAISHHLLGSAPRSALHSEKIAATIIGDCHEALRLLYPALFDPALLKAFLAGYHSERRFDILERVLSLNNVKPL